MHKNEKGRQTNIFKRGSGIGWKVSIWNLVFSSHTPLFMNNWIVFDATSTFSF
jgi:hypothetical protein